MKIVFYILFGISALAHLYFCTPPQKHVLRRYTKPLLMPLLVGCYALTVETPSVLIVIALALSCIGDVLFLLPEKTMLLRGGLAVFSAASLLYAVSCLMQLGSRHSTLMLIATVVVYTALLVLYLYKFSKYLTPAIAPFLCIASCSAMLMSLSAFFFAFTNEGVAPKLVFAGSLFFLVSGVLVTQHYLHKRFRFGNFFVMLTYLIAQSLMIFGFIGALGA